MTTVFEKNLQPILEELIHKLGDKLSSIKENHPPLPIIIKCSICIPPTDPLAWLVNQTVFPRLYFETPSSDIRLAGVGIAKQLTVGNQVDLRTKYDDINRLLKNNEIDNRFFFFSNFNLEEPITEAWGEFGKAQIYLPRFEMEVKKNQTILSCNLVVEKYDPDYYLKLLKENLALLQFRQEELSYQEESLKIKDRQDYPTYKDWISNINFATLKLQNGTFKKVVLARKTNLIFSNNQSIVQLFATQALNAENTYKFYFQPSENSTFFSLTPEMLYRRTLNNIHTISLAGTRKRGESYATDKEIEKQLLDSKKDLWEHALVSQHVESALNHLCTRFSKDDAPRIYKLRSLIHLIQDFHGELYPQVDDLKIIETIHPTPAICGYPADLALDMIEKLEHFSRGWYAGVFGYFSNDNAEMAIGIRSVLVKQQVMSLFSGAGIVAKSDPEHEWDEIEAKINYLFY